MMSAKRVLVGVMALVVSIGSTVVLSEGAYGQCYGTDLHNTAQPASGGMAGVSLARPQDVPSAVAGNPSTLARFRGTQFTFGGSFTEPSQHLDHDGTVTGGPFSANSEGQGCLLPSVGIAHDLRPLGLPCTLGLGVSALSGVSGHFRNQPNSMGSHGELMIIGINAGAAFDLTERLAAGAMLTLGYGEGSTGFSYASCMNHDFGLRGTLGLDYDLTCNTTVGAFYQTKMAYRFRNAMLTSLPAVQPATFLDLEVDQPDNVGFGIANSSLLGGNLLLAVDVLYKQWDNCNYWRDVCKNQWAFAFGTQLTHGKCRYRFGYSYADSPVDPAPGTTINGIPLPGGQAMVEYYQASSIVICKHRLTAGMGIEDILPGVTLDFYGGGYLPESHQYGTHTTASLKLWYAGAGLTWKFGPRCCR